MKVRIKFSKYGAMKFIGHLDVMRYFQKVMRRADIDIAFTGGFSPHMIMSFALPLGVGVTSSGEYLDIEIHTPISSKEAVRRLNEVMVEGICVQSFRQIEEGKSGKAMSLVAAADYTVAFREGKEPPAGWQEKFDEFLAQKQINILKKTKKSEKEVNICPMIYNCCTENEQVRMTVAAGSAANLKPELVIEAFASYIGWNMPEFSLLIHRSELYADTGTETQQKLVSLEELGEEILGS
ncbi:MAG: TIGR03936 family radical SAM-associated protein [Eubacteriales bacterium]|nr:TIGR03936 family radical SAM-associated protein [Eubacteriales bacterium]